MNLIIRLFYIYNNNNKIKILNYFNNYYPSNQAIL